MTLKTYLQCLEKLSLLYLDWDAPVIEFVASLSKDPYQILVSTLLSLRTKDQVTRLASIRLFQHANTPEKMVLIPTVELEKLIYPVGFYRKKALQLKQISQLLLDNYGGKVPENMEDLLNIKGIGRKTANLVLIHGYGIAGICVDTHVYRIHNRIGFLTAKNPDDTETKLRQKVPKNVWNLINTLFVAFGQKICLPVSPLCSNCPISNDCDKIAVQKSR